jgi:hypothetical protein
VVAETGEDEEISYGHEGVAFTLGLGYLSSVLL